MPYSSTELKEKMLAWYKQIKPETTVDIGPGCGTYSDLMRPHHECHWKAVEAWGPYVTQFGLWDKYNHVVVSDIRHCDLMSVHCCPELVIIGDCIEHMDKEEALYLIERLKQWADNVLISIPLGESPQESSEGNWFEIHRATWSHQEMKDVLSDGLKDEAEGDVLGVYWWSLNP